MCAGTPPVNPVELLNSPPSLALCAKLRGTFRYVVIDSPPVAVVADFDLIQGRYSKDGGQRKGDSPVPEAR